MDFQGKGFFMAPLITAYFMLIGSVLFKERRSESSQESTENMEYLIFLQLICQFGCCSNCHDFHVRKQVGLWGNQERGTDFFSVVSLVLQHEGSQHCGSLYTIFLNIFALLPQ